MPAVVACLERRTPRLRARRRRAQRGATLVEYILLIGCVALAAFAGFRFFGERLVAKVQDQAERVGTLTPTEGAAEPGMSPRDALGRVMPRSEPDAQAARSDAPAPIREAEQRLAHAKATLSKIPLGQHALAVLARYKVHEKVEVGTTTMFWVADNSVRFGTESSEAQLVASVVHEAHHAETYHKGTAPYLNFMSLTRDQFVDQVIEEEADGAVLEYRTFGQLEAAGIHVEPEGIATMVKDSYERAAAEARRNHPAATNAEIDAAAVKAAREDLIRAVKNDDARTMIEPDGGSGGGQNTVQWYGKLYDDLHAGRYAWANEIRKKKSGSK